MSISKAELMEISELYNDVKNLERMELKKQGYQVAATKKVEPVRLEPNYDNAGPGGTGNNSNVEIEPHPELPYMGGKAIDQPILPENAVDAVPESLLSEQQKAKKNEKRRKQQEKQRHELANRLNNKYKYKIAAPTQAPKYKPANKPSNRPKPRPAGA